MKKKLIFLLFAASFWSLAAISQKVDPQAYYTDENGNEQKTTTIGDGQAPLSVIFRSNPIDMDDHSPSYEWHFRKTEKDEGERELFVRYEEDTQYTFEESGTYHIVQKTHLMDNDVDLDSTVITITIAASKLEFPNAFSPNDDGINDVYMAKKEWKNIVKFRAVIYNRRGQKLFEWTDLNDGWNGKYNGHDVPEGVYFVQVNAKGSDGREYNIRKDVNLLRGTIEGGQTGGTK